MNLVLGAVLARLLVRRRRARERDRNNLMMLELMFNAGIRRQRPPIYCALRDYPPVVADILRGEEIATKENIKVSPASLRTVVELVEQRKRSGWAPEFEVVVFLFWLASGTGYRSVCEIFSIPKSTIFNICDRIIAALLKCLHQVIKLPTEEELAEIGEGFSSLGNSTMFSHCVGAIDGCQVMTVGPVHVQDHTYTNKKLKYSINLQGLVDHRCFFIDIFSGLPGSVHDNNILRSSSLWQDGLYPPPLYYIIGSTGYPCKTTPVTLITPFKGSLNPHQAAFNHSFSQARIVAERAFGMMKARWQMVFTKELEMKVNKSIKIVAICAMLHNICLVNDDLVEPVENISVSPRRQARDDAAGDNFRNKLLQMYIAENHL